MPGRTRDAALGSIKDRIAGHLREAIREGHYRGGDPLPSTAELADAEGAAPMTVRSAYEQLIGEGLVVAVARRGYFVREQRAMVWHMNAWQDPRRLDALPLDAWTADVEAAGYTCRQTINVGMVGADHHIATHSTGELLQLAGGDNAWVRYRMRYIGSDPKAPADEPESIADSYYPYSLVRDSKLAEPTSVNTAAVLRELGSALHHYVDELTPRIATPDEADRLQLPPSTAVLELVRIGLTAADRPVLVQHMIRPGNGSRFVYHVTYEPQAAEDPSQSDNP